jgi:hypothetical protein
MRSLQAIVSAIELAIETALPNAKHGGHLLNLQRNSGACRRRMIKFSVTGVDDRKMPVPNPLKHEEQIAERIKGLIETQPELNRKGISELVQRERGVKLDRVACTSF